jgi:hypothetical protein
VPVAEFFKTDDVPGCYDVEAAARRKHFVQDSRSGARQTQEKNRGLERISQ